MNLFKKVNPGQIDFNAFDRIGKQWMLITSGNLASYNTMTASWGGAGELWNKPVIFIFVRPQRYTFEFLEKESIFTCSFFNESHRQMLNFCGSRSGRECDKVHETGLTTFATPNASVGFEQSNLFFECLKLYAQDLNAESFIEKAPLRNYPAGDFHRMYIGEILYTGMKITEI